MLDNDFDLGLRNPLKNYYYILFYLHKQDTTGYITINNFKFVKLEAKDIKEVIKNALNLDDEKITIISINKI